MILSYLAAIQGTFGMAEVQTIRFLIGEIIKLLP